MRKQEVDLKNSNDWELVRGDVKGFIWNEIISLPCPVSSPNDALLRVIMDRTLKRMIVVRTGYSPWFGDRGVLAHRAKLTENRVWSRSRRQAECEEYRVVRRHAKLVYEDGQRAFTEWNKSILANAPNLCKWSTVKATVFSASSSLPSFVDRKDKRVWSADEKASLFSVLFDAKQGRDSFTAAVFLWPFSGSVFSCLAG